MGQEVILGIGGVRMLRELGYNNIGRFHMNEGHASLLTLELLDEEAKKAGRTTITADDVEPVREKCVFTTHTSCPRRTRSVPPGPGTQGCRPPRRLIQSQGSFRGRDRSEHDPSVLDGWWIEGHIEGLTGWSIGGNGARAGAESDRPKDAAALYDKLENVILPLFYRDRDRFADVMRFSIAMNGSFFNTQRMMHEYVLKAYF